MQSQSQMPAGLIQRIHDSDTMAVIAIAGAGTAAISWLLGVAGASRTILEILVPYSTSALTEFIGAEPSQFVSDETALAMAQSAYKRAIQLREGTAPVAGLACTATIATDRTKRGEHRCHIAVWTGTGAAIYNLTFLKGLRDRAGEDEIASKLILRALADTAGVKFNSDLQLDPSEQALTASDQYTDAIEALMAEHIEKAVVHADGSVYADESVSGGILSGSFNPLHKGHEELAQTAERILGEPITYELSIVNADKPPLSEDEVRRRIAQFAGKANIVLTRIPVFYEKSRVLPKCTFIIGVDTAIRLINPRYYGNSSSNMLLALDETRRRDCRFLVAGRAEGNEFRTLSDVRIPSEFSAIFTSIPESAFRSDISSTQIRQAQSSGYIHEQL